MNQPVFHVFHEGLHFPLLFQCKTCFQESDEEQGDGTEKKNDKRKSEKENAAGGDWELPSIFRTMRGGFDGRFFGGYLVFFFMIFFW